MKKLLIIFVPPLLFAASCEKDQKTKADIAIYEPVKENCTDISFDTIQTTNWGASVKVKFDIDSEREGILYPGVKLLDQNGTLLSVDYSFFIDKGYEFEFPVSVPDSLKGNCLWRVELIQLHKEDSVICYKEFEQCLK